MAETFKKFSPLLLKAQPTAEDINKIQLLIRTAIDPMTVAMSRLVTQINVGTLVGLTGPGVVWTNAAGAMHVDPARFIWDAANNRLVFAQNNPYVAAAGSPMLFIDQSGALYTAIEFKGSGTPRITRLDNGDIIFGTQGTGQTILSQHGLSRWTINPVGDHVVTGNIALNTGGLATNATDGFFHHSSGSGPPTGVPTQYGNCIPIYVDRLNKKLYAYDFTISPGWYLIGPGAGGAPSGPAGGDLSGTYPNPNVAAIHETSGPTQLTIGAMTAGQFVKRVGATLVTAAIAESDVTNLTTDLAGKAPTSRNINTTAPLTGGGDLSADRTLGVTDFVASGASHARGTVPDPGASSGTTKFLREDATWAVPPGTGVTSVGATAPVTSTGGSTPTIALNIDNATIINGAGVLERGHVTGNVDIPAGSNTSKVQAITETGGPTSLTIAGIPDSNPNDTVLVRGAGSSTISGTASTALRTRVDVFYFCSIPSLQPVNTANQQLATTNETPFSAGVITNPIEYPIDFKATLVYFELNLLASIGTATTVDVWVTRNGTQIAASKITFTPGTTGLGLLTAGPTATGSGASTDTYGVQMVYNGNPVTGPFGAQLAYTARVLLTAS